MPGPSLSITTHAKLQKILQCFTDVDITAYTFLTLLLNEPTYNDHPCTKDLLGNSSNLFTQGHLHSVFPEDFKGVTTI